METPVPGRAEQLLDAASRCFAAGGFHATTVAEISLEAGCSPGLLYRYYAGKEALVAALVEREAARILATLAAVRDSTDLMAALEATARTSVSDHDEAAAAALHVQIVAEAARGSSSVAGAVRRTYTDVIDALAATLRVGQDAGVVAAELDAYQTARMLVAIVNGLAVLRAVDVGADAGPPEQAVHLMLTKLLRPADAAHVQVGRPTPGGAR